MPYLRDANTILLSHNVHDTTVYLPTWYLQYFCHEIAMRSRTRLAKFRLSVIRRKVAHVLRCATTPFLLAVCTNTGIILRRPYLLCRHSGFPVFSKFPSRPCPTEDMSDPIFCFLPCDKKGVSVLAVSLREYFVYLMISSCRRGDFQSYTIALRFELP